MGLPRQSSPAEVRLEQRGFRLLETLCGSCGGAAQHVGKPSSSRDARGRVGVGGRPSPWVLWSKAGKKKNRAKQPTALAFLNTESQRGACVILDGAGLFSWASLGTSHPHFFLPGLPVASLSLCF